MKKQLDKKPFSDTKARKRRGRPPGKKNGIYKVTESKWVDGIELKKGSAVLFNDYLPKAVKDQRAMDIVMTVGSECAWLKSKSEELKRFAQANRSQADRLSAKAFEQEQEAMQLEAEARGIQKVVDAVQKAGT